MPRVPKKGKGGKKNLGGNLSRYKREKSHKASSPSLPESLRPFKPGVIPPQSPGCLLASHPKLLTLLDSLFGFRDDPLVHGAKEN